MILDDTYRIAFYATYSLENIVCNECDKLGRLGREVFIDTCTSINYNTYRIIINAVLLDLLLA